MTQGTFQNILSMVYLNSQSITVLQKLPCYEIKKKTFLKHYFTTWSIYKIG
jgi:hypothetical protein